MHAVVVETDPETAEIKILRYCVVHDCGTLINPMIVEGQIHGGVAQGVGGALYERMEYAADGQLLNASFMDFLMPYASEVPDIEIDHLVTPSPLNPLGVKGAGEAGVIPGSAAIAAAIEDAEGITITRMPISPSELFALRSKHAPGGRMKIIGNAQFAADRAVGLAGPERPGRAGAHHPRLPAARGARRRRVHHDGRGRGRLHQGRVRRAGAAHRPAAARLVPHARPGRRCRRARSAPTCS